MESFGIFLREISESNQCRTSLKIPGRVSEGIAERVSEIPGWSSGDIDEKLKKKLGKFPN